MIYQLDNDELMEALAMYMDEHHDPNPGDAVKIRLVPDNLDGHVECQYLVEEIQNDE